MKKQFKFQFQFLGKACSLLYILPAHRTTPANYPVTTAVPGSPVYPSPVICAETFPATRPPRGPHRRGRNRVPGYTPVLYLPGLDSNTRRQKREMCVREITDGAWIENTAIPIAPHLA